jgi:hypoxanthine-guanine phosphoribosyltransferase
MPDLIPVLSREEIVKAFANHENRISTDLTNCVLTFGGIFKGALIFLGELFRYLKLQAQNYRPATLKIINRVVTGLFTPKNIGI